jgi:hypothetical protein
MALMAEELYEQADSPGETIASQRAAGTVKSGQWRWR